MAHVLCITGMHRSGTSLAASWLEACGLPIHQGRVWGPAEGNPLGHFEDRDFEELHRAAVLRHYPESQGWVVGELEELTFDVTEREQAQRLVRERAVADPWGWKDPRSLLFLREWMNLVPDLHVLVLRRDRVDVIDSLLRRAATATNPRMLITAEDAARAFDAYNLVGEQAKQVWPERVQVVDLADLLAFDAQVFSQVQERVGGLSYVPLAQVYRSGHLGGSTLPVPSRRHLRRRRWWLRSVSF